ncbi:MAG TPA: hypothetical protein VEC16_06510 [Alphaproteobacteria bacterium]|nr:hypothetical protein [Alphaproteobacteria bacterium]
MTSKNSIINQHYSTQISAIKKALSSENVVQLQEFFDKEFYYTLLSQARKSKLKQDVDIFEYRYKSGKISLPKEFEDFIKKITGKKFKYQIIELEHKDYSLIHDKKAEIAIDLTENWLNGWGGYLMYNDGSGNVTKIPSKQNSLTISNGKIFGAIKYVNNHSGKNKKLYIIGR